MGRRPEIDLFCEDAGHEAFARACAERLAGEAGLPRPTITARSARGGHGRAVTELANWQRTLRGGGPRPDLLLVLIDANGEGWAVQRRNVEAAIEEGLFPAVIVACPDPHVEAWCAADPAALRTFTGRSPPVPPGRPGRGAYKAWLRRVQEEAGETILNDPMDISAELVPLMNLFDAGKASRSLGALVQDLSSFFLRFRDLG